MDSPLVRIRDLKLEASTQRGTAHILRGVSLDIGRGRILGVVGESGSGKSSLASCLLRLLPSNMTRLDGSIEFDGTDLVQLDDAAMAGWRGKRIAMIFQDPMTALNPLFTVATHLVDVLRRRHPGIGREDVVGRRIPVDHGIAGYIAMTGQPIAVSNVQADPRFKKDFAQSTGYVPRSILGTPLFSDGQVIGVMEVLDKLNAAAFGLQDMELLGVFAQQAALAIHQSQQYDKISGALVRGLRAVVDDELSPRPAALLAALDADAVDALAAENDLDALAALFYALSARGPAERKACLQILAAFAAYANSGRR